jgi:Na+/proline symporter
MGLHYWDYVALAAYLLGITLVGLWTVLKVKDTADFFMGGRMHNKWFMMFFSFGAGTSGNDAVGVSAKTYTSGMSGIWYQWLWLFATPFYWLIAPVMRRMRSLTTGDYFALRYGGSVEALYSVVGVLQLTFNMGVLLRGGGAMIEAVSGGAIAWEAAAVAMTVLFVVYGIAGGLTAAIVTDFVQGILTIVLSFMLLPVALKHVGGMTNLRETIADPAMFSLVSPGEINGFHIVVLCVMSLIGIVTQPHILGVCAAGRSEMDGRFGFAAGNLLKRFCTIAWMLVGLCAVAMYPGLTVQQADNVYGMVAHDLLPQVMPGLVGIFLAALLASIMSSCDAFMVACSGLFTQNFYRKYVTKSRPDEHYVLVGRIVSFLVVLCSLSIAFSISNVPAGLEWFFRIQALMGAAFWLGLFWRRTTATGVWLGTLAALGVTLITELRAFQPFWAEHLPDFMLWEDKFRFSYSVCFYLTAAFAVTIVVSLFTKRRDSSKLDQLFNCLRTPVVGDEPHAAPFTLPEGVVPGNPRKLINHPDWEIYWPSKVSVIGFAIMWAWVLGIIGLVYWISGIGA